MFRISWIILLIMVIRSLVCEAEKLTWTISISVLLGIVNTFSNTLILFIQSFDFAPVRMLLRLPKWNCCQISQMGFIISWDELLNLADSLFPPTALKSNILETHRGTSVRIFKKNWFIFIFLLHSHRAEMHTPVNTNTDAQPERCMQPPKQACTALYTPDALRGKHKRLLYSHARRICTQTSPYPLLQSIK